MYMNFRTRRTSREAKSESRSTGKKTITHLDGYWKPRNDIRREKHTAADTQKQKPPAPTSTHQQLPTTTMMKNFSFVAVVLLSLLFGISSGFVVPSTSALNVRQSQQSGGMRMFFGGGGAKKAAATSKGIVVKVQQKTGFKETELVLKGKTNLRKALLENKIDVYPLQGKIYNCGGGGSCGTCAVNVVAGASNCSPKGPGEKKLLDKKPASYRLSCCTMVSGPVTIKTKP